MIARREATLEKVRKLNPYRDITDPVAWQREMREDLPLVTRIPCGHENTAKPDTCKALPGMLASPACL